MLDNFAESAKTLTLVAIIIEAVFSLLLTVYFLVILGLTAAVSSGPGFPGLGLAFLFIIGLIFGLIGLLWVLLDYFLVYKRILEENIASARDTSLILGIIQLILGGVVPGILLIVAYTQLSNSMSRSEFRQQN